MADTHPTPCEFVLIRLAPDPIRAEHINIGVALYAAGAGGFAGVRVNPDWSRARSLAPGFDPADLTGLEADLLDRLRSSAPPWRSREYFLQFAQESFSHCLQLTTPTAILTSDPAAELDRLYRQYAAPLPRLDRSVPAGARRRILDHLQRVFAEERVLPHLQRRLHAGEWLGRPDPFRFDFAYQADGLRHAIQAAPIEAPESAIKSLCFTVQRLRTALGQLDVAAFSAPQARRPMSRVGDDGSGFDRDQPPAPGSAAALHREWLTDAGVRVLDLGEAPAEAARIRQALHIY